LAARKETIMPEARFTLPPLPFDPTAFAPAISAATFEQHHAGHHQAYVAKLNTLAGEEGLETESLLTIIRETADADPDEVSELVSAGDLFVHAAQHFNHAFYWKSLLSAHDAQTPVIEEGLKPLLVIDLWEHAYYLDHQRQRKAYLEAVVRNHLNWDFAATALAADTVEELDLGIGNDAMEAEDA
jgi:Fe-Mn family superoxide dismutase